MGGDRCRLHGESRTLCRQSGWRVCGRRSRERRRVRCVAGARCLGSESARAVPGQVPAHRRQLGSRGRGNGCEPACRVEAGQLHGVCRGAQHLRPGRQGHRLFLRCKRSGARSARRAGGWPRQSCRRAAHIPSGCKVRVLMNAHVLIASLLFAGAAFAQQPQWRAPRTADGHPDLQGIWTSATITPLERPDEFGGRRALTPEETARLEGAEASLVSNSAKPTDLKQALPGDCKDFGRGCGYNNFWLDRGSQVVTIDGEKRTSLLVDPPDGRIPPLTAERRQYMAGRAQQLRQNYDGPEARPLGERCLLAFGSSSGPPMLPVLYNNHYQIVQNKDTVLILVEMVHDARIIRLNGKPLPKHIRKWMGDSTGRWEADTLVVETTSFTEQESFRGSTPDLKVIERFTRVAPDTIIYQVT